MTNGRDKKNKVKKGVRDTYLESLQRVIGHELPGYENLSKQEAEEARHIFDLQFKQLSQDMIDAGENPLKPEKRHVDFLLEPIDDWLRYLRYRTVFKKDNQIYGRFLSKLAWEDLSIYIANSFYKKHKYLPYQIITKEDLHQEAHLALLTAKKDYRPDRGTIKAFYFTAVYNHFFKLYEKANAEKRKSENTKYRLKYIPAYSETFMEPEPETFWMINLPQDDENTISHQRFISRERFETYDEQEYREPPRIELRDGSEHDVYFVGSQLFINTDKKSSKGIKSIEKVSCPLGYGKGQDVWRGQSYPINEYEQISNILYFRRQKVLYRTPYFRSLISGSSLKDYSDEEKQKYRVTCNPKEERPALASGYLYRTRIKIINNALRGVGFDGKKAYLPDRSRDIKRQFSIKNFKVIKLPPEHELIIKYRMSRARRIYTDLSYEDRLIRDLSEFEPFRTEGKFRSNYDELYQKAWGVIGTFPDQQQRLFELFYKHNELIITAKSKQKMLFDSFNVTVHEDRKISDSEFMLSENIRLKYTLKSIARVLKARYANILNLHTQGVKELSGQFTGTFK